MTLPFYNDSLTTLHLWFTVEATTPLELNEYSGASLRGNFFNAIWERFCTNKSAPSCAECVLHKTCPVSTLVAPLREGNSWGQDIPRPYIMIPPQAGARYYHAGERFSFGMTLIGNVAQLLPYILLSLTQQEVEGIGNHLNENSGQRGRFRVEQVECTHPLTQQRQTLYSQGNTYVQVPIITVTPQDHREQTTRLSTERITLHFATPLRLIDQKHLVKYPDFRTLVQRLLERYLALERYYGNQEITFEREEKDAWLRLADTIQCTANRTRWQDLSSYSRRQQRSTPIGGLIGTATFEGDLAPFLELLVIGELVHVGKNVVKGDGCYHIVV